MDSVQSVCLSVRLVSVLSVTIHACQPQCLDPGAESCFLDWAVALPVNQLSSPTVSGSFGPTDSSMLV